MRALGAINLTVIRASNRAGARRAACCGIRGLRSLQQVRPSSTCWPTSRSPDRQSFHCRSSGAPTYKFARFFVCRTEFSL